MHVLSVVFRILRLKDGRTPGALLNRLRVWDAKQEQVRKGVNYSPPCRIEESEQRGGIASLDLQLHSSLEVLGVRVTVGRRHPFGPLCSLLPKLRQVGA